MKTRQRKVFEKIVNPLILKHLVSNHGYDGSCIASGIPIKYLKYFKEVSAQKMQRKLDTDIEVNQKLCLTDMFIIDLNHFVI